MFDGFLGIKLIRRKYNEIYYFSRAGSGIIRILKQEPRGYSEPKYNNFFM
jgi:hypothetical protein